MALSVVATTTAKPGSETIVHDALRTLVTHSRTEDGCLSYVLYRSADDPAVFVTFEEWRDRADLDAHLRSPHIAEAFAAAGEHMAGPPVVQSLERVEV